MTNNSNIIDTLESEKKELPFLLPELEVTEIEKFIKDNPAIARVFIEKYAKGEIAWESFTPHERGILLHGIVEASVKDPEQIAAIKALKDADWLREPPTPEEFVNDPKYLGKEISKSIYAPWRKDLIYVLDPKNEIHEWILSGGIGVGKCVSANSFVFNNLGILKIEELYKKREDIKEVLSESGLKEVIDFHDEGMTETNTLITQQGFEIEARPNHRIRVFNGKNIEWKATKDIEIKDTTILVKNMSVWGVNPYNITTAEAELIGIITGDGHIKDDHSIELTFGPALAEQEYQSIAVSIIKECALNPKEHKYYRADTKQTVHRVGIYNTETIRRWKNLGLEGRAWEKKVPFGIRMGTKEVVAAFIRGLFDTDGTVYEKGNSVEFSTCSKELAEQVQVIFLNFGIRSSRSFKENDFRGSWTVRLIGRESKELFAKEIGFNHPEKAARLTALLEKEATTWRHNDHEVIPISWEEVAKVRDSVRGKGLDLKNNRDMFVCVKTKGKQAFTYKALDKIVEIFGEQYLTPILKKIYKERYIFDSVKTKEKTLSHCYDLTVKDDPSYISNGFISHNTRIAIISQLYKLCVLTCLRNIPSYFGLDNATTISFGLFSLSLEKAESAISEDFKKIIGQSPYFKNVFPLKKSRTIKKILNNTSTNKNSQAEYEVQLPQGLAVLMGSKVSHALSFAVVSAILDEMNFRGKRTVKFDEDEDSSEKLYSQIRFRITSRFERLGYVPGLLCVISSRKTSSDFLESRISQIDGGLSSRTGSWRAKNDPRAFISNYSQWDVKPDKYYEDGDDRKHFYVFVGSSKTSSRILTPAELDDYPKDSPNIIEVPESVRPHFERDVNGALRELAGISSSPQHLLFEDPAQLKKLWDKERKSPFIDDNLYIGLKTPRSISSHLIPQNMFFDAGFAMVPKYHPNMLRVLHIDLSKDGDATGIAMGGVSGIKEMVGSNILGQKIISSYSPEFFIDFAISIRAPQGDQVDYEKIQQFINYLRAMKFRIHYITFDRYQSVGSMQMLIKDGFKVDNLSVDTSDIPYVMLRDAVSKGNVKIYHQPELERELVNLVHDYSGARARVDHPRMNPDGTKGRKDVSDAVAGVIANAFALLTDFKKHPDTANAEMAARIINSLYPNKINPADAIGNYFANVTTENEEINKHIEEMNPFSFKIT